MTSITDLFSLDGKVAVVTGASSGLGVAFAAGVRAGRRRRGPRRPTRGFCIALGMSFVR